MSRWRKRRKKRGFLDYLNVVVLLSVAILAAGWLEALNEEKLDGAFTVVDGDSLKQGERKIRLIGIDAPEFTQQCVQDGARYACGRRSRDHLRVLMSGGSISCRGSNLDKYERLLVECFSGEASLNKQMVLDGWALAYGDFEGAETTARSAKRGVWAGDFERPDSWRSINGGLLEGEHDFIFDRLGRWVRTQWENWF